MKLKLTKIGLGALSLFAVPFVVFGAGELDTISEFLALATSLIDAILPIIIGLAVLYFVWGLLKYVTAKDSDGQREARSVMFMGIIVLFVMVSVWGLVNILVGGLGLKTAAPPPPQIPTANKRSFSN